MINSDQILNDLISIAKEHSINIPKNSQNLTLKHLGIDSLKVFTIILKLEDKYSVHLSNEQLANLQTLQNLIDAFVSTINNK